MDVLKRHVLPAAVVLAAMPGLAQAEFTIHNLSKGDWFVRPYTQSAAMAWR